MYRVRQFGGVLLPELVQDGDMQNIGSGLSLTAYLQTIGGGFLDAYGDLDSPEDIQPISKTCELSGDDAADLKAQYVALRGKKGKRDKLTVEWDDHTLWWQWARLVAVDAAQPANMWGTVLPIDLSWQTNAQHWYGIRYKPTAWQVGDDSFYLGDGTTFLGQGGLRYTWSSNGQSIVVSNGGNINAVNLQVDITAAGVLGSVNEIVNETTGQILQYAGGLANGDVLSLHCGAQRALKRVGISAVSLTSISVGVGVLEVETGGHTFTTGDYVDIVGTTLFNGRWGPVTVAGNNFTAPLSPYAQLYGTEASGTVYKSENAWSILTPSDPARWLMLAPGDNRLTFTSGNFNSGSTIDFTYYDHYR